MSLPARRCLGGAAVLATVVITGRGTLPQAPDWQKQGLIVVCRYGFQAANGFCRPSSWAGAGSESSSTLRALPP